MGVGVGCFGGGVWVAGVGARGRGNVGWGDGVDEVVVGLRGRGGIVSARGWEGHEVLSLREDVHESAVVDRDCVIGAREDADGGGEGERYN